MSIRVYELAKELKIDSSNLISKLEGLDIYVKSHASTITEEQAELAKNTVLGPEPKEVVERRLKPGIIRRRAKKPVKIKALTPEEAPPPEKEVEKAKAKPPTQKDAKGKKTNKDPRVSAKTTGHLDPVDEKKPSRPGKKDKREKKAASSSRVAEPSSETEPSVDKASAVEAALAAKVPYMRPSLHREQSDLLQKVEDTKEKVSAVPSEKTGTEEEKRKKRKKKTTKDEVKEETLPVKKTAKKGVSRRREIITRQELLDNPDRKYRPLRKKKKSLPKKMMKKTAITTPKAQKRIIRISETIQVGELAKRMGIKAYELLKKLSDLGVMTGLHQYIDFEEAVLVAGDYGYEVANIAVEEEILFGDEKDDPENYETRPPVVTVMGHVDHGKTTLLDAIRKSDVVESEKGGITQHIGAYTVTQNEHEITFIDTPGHEAFTSMRARGAKATDIVILVVAADDGVMDRTKEAINHARDANVPILVAVNKIDKPDADPDKVKRQLAELGLNPEEWGGDTIFANVSAKEGTGIDDLLEALLLQAEVMELEANPKIAARGVVAEANVDKGHGPIATALVHQGTLNRGDVVIAGKQWGRVRIMLDADGKEVKNATPSHAVAIVGLSGTPMAGDPFNVVKDEKVAKQIVDQRITKQKDVELTKSSARISFDELYERLQAMEAKELKVILKADVHGSVEAISDSLMKLSTEKCKLTIVHSAVGTITENDIMLANASGAMILGFSVKADAGARKAAEKENVELKFYDIIYELLDNVTKFMEGTLDPEYLEQVIGHAEVREVFAISRLGKIAGSYVTDGKIVRNAQARVLRNTNEIWSGKVAGLKRFKDDVKEVIQASECGIRLDTFDELEAGDIVEVYTLEEVQPSL